MNFQHFHPPIGYPLLLMVVGRMALANGRRFDGYLLYATGIIYLIFGWGMPA